MSNMQNSNVLEQFSRNNYFYGKLMTVRDFKTEQSYVDGKRRLINRLTTGTGIVRGLGFAEGDVYTENGIVKIVFQTGGVVIDCFGREIVIPVQEQKEIMIEQNQSKVNLTLTHLEEVPYYIYLHYLPVEYEMVSSRANPNSCGQECSANRIREDFEVIASTEPPPVPAIACPDISIDTSTDTSTDISTDTSTDISNIQVGDNVLETVKTWLKDHIAAKGDCQEDGVFILALAQGAPGNDTVTIDTGTTMQYLHLVPGNKELLHLLNCHMIEAGNPHQVTAEQVEALSIYGGTVTGSVIINTTEWSALTASASTTHGVLGRLTDDLTTGASYRCAGVVGISEIDEKHGVYAKAPTTGHALYVEGDAFFTGAKTGYVADIFKNGSGADLKTGDVVKLKNVPISRFYGNNDKIPVPEITLAVTPDDECIIGVVDRRALHPGKENSSPAMENGAGYPDISVIPDGEECYVVTLGAYARCKADAAGGPIKRGSLLTTGSTPGCAQIAVSPKLGRILGKALEPLDEGIGYIAVFVNMQ